jgi:hypothetical protein
MIKTTNNMKQLFFLKKIKNEQSEYKITHHNIKTKRTIYLLIIGTKIVAQN